MATVVTIAVLGMFFGVGIFWLCWRRGRKSPLNNLELPAYTPQDPNLPSYGSSEPMSAEPHMQSLRRQNIRRPRPQRLSSQQQSLRQKSPALCTRSSTELRHLMSRILSSAGEQNVHRGRWTMGKDGLSSATLNADVIIPLTKLIFDARYFKLQGLRNVAGCSTNNHCISRSHARAPLPLSHLIL